MKEELYVMTPDGVARVDLNDPSGIQLNYKSNLFSDLSKITCSHSYTFKLPLTINNRRIFDYAEDIRHQSSMIRKRLTASYSQNGVNLFQNANLYIESVESCYNAVMTWDVIGGMNSLKENDISLRELPNDNTETYFGFHNPSTEDESFDNTALVLHPIYDSGIPYFRWKIPYVKTTGRPNTSRYTSFSAYPMPVVPVYKLVQLINSHFGTKFNLGNPLSIGDAKKYDPKRKTFEKGVLPLVGLDLNYEQRQLRKCVLSGIKRGFIDATIKEENELYIPDVIQFTQIVANNDMFEVGSLKVAKHDSSGTTHKNVGVKPKVKNLSVEIDGCLQMTFNDYPANRHVEQDDVPRLSIYQRQQVWFNTRAGGRSTIRTYYEWVELDSVDGEAVGSSNGYRIYEFDFALENGATRLTCDNIKERGGSLLFVFSHRIYSIISMQKDIEVFLINNDKCISPRNIDVIGNLPDIGCLAFMKSLFYMMGAFPYVNSEQEIIPRFYTELRENLDAGNVLDWSKKLPGAASDMPNSINFATSDYAQSNYYIMKSDDIDAEYDPENLDDDVYASGIGKLVVDNSTLEVSNTVIQLPFFAPYKLNRKLPSYDTGYTIKSWTLSDSADPKERNVVYNRLEYCNPEPAYGIIEDRDISSELNTGEIKVDGKVMTMKIWNGFSFINTIGSGSYDYLQQIIQRPFIIKEDMYLDEFDLMDIDYTKPIYLDKYNSYFAIVSIQRDSKGKCKCELIKLP